MTAERVNRGGIPTVAEREPQYEPRAVLTALMLTLTKERVPFTVRSTYRALEAAGRLLEALEVEPVDDHALPDNVLPFLPRRRPAVER